MFFFGKVFAGADNAVSARKEVENPVAGVAEIAALLQGALKHHWKRLSSAFGHGGCRMWEECMDHVFHVEYMLMTPYVRFDLMKSREVSRVMRIIYSRVKG